MRGWGPIALLPQGLLVPSPAFCKCSRISVNVLGSLLGPRGKSVSSLIWQHSKKIREILRLNENLLTYFTDVLGLPFKKVFGRGIAESV